MMFKVQKNRVLSFLLAGITVVFGAACGKNSSSGETAGLVVVNATGTGTVKRVLVRENTDVAENTGLIEIAVALNITGQATNSDRPPVDRAAQSREKLIADAEQQLQRAAVELQRIEPLVASGGAPQSHLDAARAEFQQAQERSDELRRATTTAPNPPPDSALPGTGKNPAQNASSPAENVIVVRTPVSGNVRVISVRVNESVKAGEPIATISTTQ